MRLIALFVPALLYILRKCKPGKNEAKFMRTQKIQIEGEKIENLHDLIIERWEPSYIYQDGQYCIYMNEEHYFRIESNLLSVLIVKFLNSSGCEIEIVTGGGKNEMDFDWGAENKQNGNLIKVLIEICESNTWTIKGLDMEDYQKYKKKNLLDKIVDILEK